MEQHIAPPGASRRHCQDLDGLDEALHAIAANTRQISSLARSLQAQVEALSKYVLRAAAVVEQAKRHRDG